MSKASQLLKISGIYNYTDKNLELKQKIKKYLVVL